MKKAPLPLIDRVISFFSPSWARNRYRARLQMDLLGRAYEGASKSPRLSMWGTANNDANAEIKAAGSALRARARDLIRNNPYAGRILEVIVSNTVGSGIKPQIGSDEGFERDAEKALWLWEEWTESTQIDFDRHLDLHGLQELYFRTMVESGEVLVRRVVLAGRKFPISYQILEPDFIDTGKDEDLPGGGRIVQGIEFNKKGEKVAYWLFEDHPGSKRGISPISKRVSSENIHHKFRKDRPGQIRGASWFAPVMIRLYELDKFQDATIRKQQIAACFAAFVYDAEGANPIANDGSQEILERMDSGTIEILPPGKDIKFASPPPSNDYQFFVKTEHGAIASGMNVTYEDMTGDYKGATFSSARMGALSFQRSVKKWQKQLIINGLMSWVWEDFREMAFLNMIDMDHVWVNWTLPAREMIDPTKEVSAIAQAISSGQMTLSEALRARGFDPYSVFTERKAELDFLDKLGVLTDSDPRMNTIFYGGDGNAATDGDDTADEEDSDENAKARCHGKASSRIDRRRSANC